MGGGGVTKRRKRQKDRPVSRPAAQPSGIRGHLAIHAAFDEMKDWHPHQVKAFMAGVAEVVAASKKAAQ